MKKRAMKKWIPQGYYCYGRVVKVSKGTVSVTGMCRNYVYSHTVDDMMIQRKEMGSTKTVYVPCKTRIYRCRYTGVRTDEDFCLYDDCKICGVKEPHWDLEATNEND